MALLPRSAILPLGQFDLVDTEMSSILGGEVMAFTSKLRTLSASEKAAQDALDGYLYDGAGSLDNRPALTRAGAGDVNRMLVLADDGTAGYGTYFGSVIGTPVGLSTTGTDLGPHSSAASGKLTVWNQPGLYAVTVTAVASDFVSTIPGTGLQPGASIGYNASAKLAHTSCTGAVANSGVAYFVEFESSSSLVTTPGRLVGASESWPNVLVNAHMGSGTRAL